MESCSSLTSREIQVLRLVCHGFPNKEIGDLLGISAATAERHREHITRKVGIEPYSQSPVSIVINLIRYALKHQIIPYDVWVNANVTGHAVLALP